MSVMTRLDDALSPIVVKELRQAVQSRLVVSVLMLFLLIECGVMGFFLLAAGIDPSVNLGSRDAGRNVFTTLQGIMLATCMLFLPAYTGLRLAAERSETDVDLLFVTTLRPRSIISGKLLAAMILALLIFSACTPFMAFTYFLRGIDLPSVFIVLALDFLAVMIAVMATIFVAVIPLTRILKAMIGLFTVISLVYLFAGTLLASFGLLELGVAYFLDQREGLYACLCMLVGTLGGCGLLFAWSVALVNPPPANRALAMRVLIVLYWIGSGAAFGYCAVHIEQFLPVWLVLTGCLLALCLAIAINERERWSPRVARTIPRWWLFRLPAFLLYSGSAGGVLLSVILFFLSGLIAWLWPTFTTGAPPLDLIAGREEGGLGRSNSFLIVGFDIMAMIFLYTYAYGLTAVFLRNTLLPMVAPLYNWVIMLVVAVVASILPLLIAVLVQQDVWRYDTHWYWLLTNPMGAVNAVGDWHSPWTVRREMFYLFILTWSGIVTALNARWFLSQLWHFRPFVPHAVFVDDEPATARVDAEPTTAS